MLALIIKLNYRDYIFKLSIPIKTVKTSRDSTYATLLKQYAVTV